MAFEGLPRPPRGSQRPPEMLRRVSDGIQGLGAARHRERRGASSHRFPALGPGPRHGLRLVCGFVVALASMPRVHEAVCRWRLFTPEEMRACRRSWGASCGGTIDYADVLQRGSSVAQLPRARQASASRVVPGDVDVEAEQHLSLRPGIARRDCCRKPRVARHHARVSHTGVAVVHTSGRLCE